MDFCILNNYLVNINASFPPERDCIYAIGQSHCKVISIADLRYTYHTLKFYGSSTYSYLRSGMGLSMSPATGSSLLIKCLKTSQIRKDTKL